MKPNGTVSTSEPLRLAFTFDSRSSWLAQGLTLEQIECEEFDTDETIEAIASALKKLGTVEMIGGVKALAKRLVSSDPEWDLVFNLAEGRGAPVGREGQVPALLEAWDIPFTFSDSATLGLCLDKAKTKMVLEHYQIPTSPFATIPPRDSWPKSGFDPISLVDNGKYRAALQVFPLFVKPASTGSSIGIGKNSKVSSREELLRTIEEISTQHPTASLLVERFLSGREFTVGLIGTGANAKIIGVREYIFLKDNPQCPIDPAISYTCNDPTLLDIDVYSHELKKNWSPNPQQVQLDHLNDPVTRSVGEAALKACRVLGCRDAGRIDIRHNSKDLSVAVPNFIEVNPICGLTPNWSDFPLLGAANGIDYDQLLQLIVQSALERYK